MSRTEQPIIIAPETLIIDQLLSQESIMRIARTSAEEMGENFDSLTAERRFETLISATSIQERKAAQKFRWHVWDHPKIKGKPKPVSFMGGAYAKESSRSMLSMEVLIELLAEKGISIVTGGGPGIMTASNKIERYGIPGISVQLKGLSSEQVQLKTEFKIALSDFGIRQTLIMDISDVHIFYPGGMGTRYEIGETTTKAKTDKWGCPKFIILFDDVDSDPHWKLLHAENKLYVKDDLLRFNAHNIKTPLFEKLSYKKEIDEMITSMSKDGTLNYEQIIFIAQAYSMDLDLIIEILLETIYIRLKFGQEHLAIEEMEKRGFIKTKRNSILTDYRGKYI
jgi:predicted Rossmann-fold nucleotide-binding protein